MKKILFLVFVLSFNFGIAQDLSSEEQKKIAISYIENNPEEILKLKVVNDKIHDEVIKGLDRVKNKNVVELTKELIEKEKIIKTREDEIRIKEESLRKSEENFAQKIKKFDDDSKRFIGCIEDIKDKENARVGKMVKIISNMKPVKAAELLETQDSAISVKILTTLDPVLASKIFNNMDKESSARLQKQYLNMER